MVHSVPERNQAPEQLNSGVWLAQSVDLYNAYASAVDANDAISLAALSAGEALLSGMIGSDGVVVFGNNGSVLAYRDNELPLFFCEDNARRSPIDD